MLYTAVEVREIRKRSGLSRTAFAARIGVGYQTLVRWERKGIGDRALAKSVDALRRLMAE